MEETYRELTERQQEEFNNEAPIKFAFSQEQFEKVMAEWDLDPEKDLDKLYRLDGGGLIQRKDNERFWQLMDRQRKEREDRIKADTTGDGFIYQMFLYELAEHEYIVTGDTWETLDSLGYTLEDVKKDPALFHGLQKAAEKIAGKNIAFLAGLEEP